MRYLLTFCVIKGHGLANPLGHSFIILSQQADHGQQIEVKHAFGFQAALMTEFDTYWAKLKNKLNFKFDFTGKFGVWKIEDMRWLDLGYGLSGVSLIIDQSLYDNLVRVYQRRLADQAKAIEEAKSRLGDVNLAPQSLAIYNEEIRLAIAENRAPRLELFEFKVEFSWYSLLSMEKSNTCKTMAIKLMQEAGVPEFFLNHITNNGKSRILPRFGGRDEPIILFSEGERQLFESRRTGEMRFFRQWGFRNDRLFFTLPPQLCFTPNETNPFQVNLTQDEKHDLYGYLKQLQRLELLLAPLRPPMGYSGLIDFEHKRLVERIVTLYTYFSTVNNETPRDDLLLKLNDAKYFLNGLYFAINDNWDGNNEIETVANRYSVNLQEKICDILERPLAKSTLCLQS